jgi:putative addiction module killer protein
MSDRKVTEYQTDGSSLFANRFAGLDACVAVKVAVAPYRLEHDNFSYVKAIRKSVSEYKIAFGSGYLICFRQEGSEIVILLGGSPKKTRVNDISAAQNR